MAAGLARWAWELASQAAWECLATQLLRTTPAFLANATLPGTVPANLLGAGPSTETVQAVGTVWTWSCYALAAWRKRRPGAEDPPSSAQHVPAQPPPCTVRREL